MSRRDTRREDRPDVGRARAELDRVTGQRDRVQDLVDALLTEKRQNNFAAHVFEANPRRKT